MCHQHQKVRFFYKSFTLEPETNGYSENYYSDASTKEKCELFIKILIFLHLSEVKEVHLKPNGKVGDRRNEKVMNKTTHPFIVVDTTWNITSIRTKGFTVSGHFRLQPYGKDRALKKLIFVDQFEKEGYIRKAKHLKK